MSTPDHEHIWLQNAEDAAASHEGRLWCQDKVWPADGTDGEPTEYVRADMVDAARAQARREALEEAEHAARNSCLIPPDGGEPTEADRLAAERAAAAIQALMDKREEPGG